MLLDIPDTATLDEARHWLKINRARIYGDTHIYTVDAIYEWNSSRRLFERVAHLPDATATRPVVAPPPAPRWGFWKGFWFGALLAWIPPSGGGYHHHGDDCGY